jgi:hypothetical protein
VIVDDAAGLIEFVSEVFDAPEAGRLTDPTPQWDGGPDEIFGTLDGVLRSLAA